MSFDQAGINYVRQGLRTGKVVGGLGGAIIGGATMGRPSISDDGHQRSTGSRVARGVIGAGIGGYTGRAIGGLSGTILNASKWQKGFRPEIARPAWLKNAKTKAEAKAAFRAQAKKTHPDHGGNSKDFQKIHSEWKQHESTFKVAMFTAFQDELEKIASLGALLGGVAGYKLGPNTSKGKIVGTLVGAGLGHAIGSAGGAMKRKVDEHHEREIRELYSHEPVAGQSASLGSNFY